jgi:hypothetical protein
MQNPNRSGTALLRGRDRGRSGAALLCGREGDRNQEADGCYDEVEAYFRGCTVIADNAFPLAYVMTLTCGSDAGKKSLINAILRVRLYLRAGCPLCSLIDAWKIDSKIRDSKLKTHQAAML